jgi:hypothetical protein
MNMSSLRRGVRAIVSFTAPMTAVALWTRVSFDAGYSAGWLAFQGPDSVMANGHPNHWIAASMIAGLSLILIARGRAKIGNALAITLCLLAGVAWLGLTG